MLRNIVSCIMKKIKQELLIALLKSGKYRVEHDGVLYKEKVTGIWKQLVGNKLQSGYTQLILCISEGYGKSIRLICYKHIVIYMANFWRISGRLED